MVLRQSLTQEKPFKNETTVEYYLKTEGEMFIF